MRKRILSTLLALCLVLGMLPGVAWATVVASGECGDGVTWSLDDAGTLTIGGTGNMATYSSGERPWADNLYDIQTVVIEHGVTSISRAAFSGCLKLGRVIIPVGITSIPRNAFRQCTNLTSVNIPEGVTIIGIQAFYGCTNLRSLVIPASVDYIEAEALRNIHEQSKLYFNGYLPNISSDSLASDATLYYIAGTAGWDKLALGNETALWGGGSEVPDTEQTYQVTYKLSGGTGNFPPTTGLLPGVKVWAPSSIPTRDGCKFYGWYDVDEEGNDAANGIFAYVYEPGKINNYFRMPERDVVLKAIWVDPMTGVLKPDLGDEENPDPGTNPNPPIPGDGSIVSLSPISGAEDVGYDASNPPVFKIEFDREIASAYDQEFVADVDLTMDGAFSIYRASDDKLIYKPSEYAKFAFNLDTAKTVLTVTPVNNHTLLEPNTQYYITMGEGFVRFADGTGSPAIEKGEWGFTTKQSIG